MQREIKVIANSQNRNEVYMSDAETFGELKAELINKGYVVEDMDFKEGKTRIDLRNELSPLPSNFMYKGVETNDLVIMITPQNTKIKSGMTNYRRNLYATIKEYGLQSRVRTETGKNFTQCSDSVLSSIIADYEAETFMEEQENTITVDTVKTIVNEELDKREAQSEYSLNSLALCVLKVINFFESVRIVSKTTCDHWRKAIRKDYTPYTQEELDSMND
jgi:hypothetical protein